MGIGRNINHERLDDLRRGRGPVQERCSRCLTVQLHTDSPHCTRRTLSHLMLIAVSWQGVCMRHGACTRRGKKISKLADGMMPSRIVHRGHIRPAVLHQAD